MYTINTSYIDIIHDQRGFMILVFWCREYNKLGLVNITKYYVFGHIYYPCSCWK